MSAREDTTSRTEADAAEWAQWLGRSEDFGGEVGDQEANPLLDEPDARNRPDPWLPYTCQRCGSVNTAGIPEKCDGCGLRNWWVG